MEKQKSDLDQQRLASAASRKSQKQIEEARNNDDTADKDDEEKKKSKAGIVCKKVLKFTFSTVGLSLLVILYTIAGGFIFEHLEKLNEKTECENSKVDYDKAENATVELMWDINLQTDLDEQAKKDRYVEKLRSFSLSVLDTGYNVSKDCSRLGEPGGPAYNWSLPGALLFAVTVITTIGYGNISPKTMWGRIVCMAYAMLGIPIMLLCLANIGDVLADMFRFIYSNACCCGCCRKKEKKPGSRQVSPEPQTAWKTDESGMPIPPSKNQDDPDEDDEEEEEEEDQITVPLTITMIVIIGFIMFGAVLFMYSDQLEFLEACYFSFITLSTIGFGDIVPGTSNIDSADSIIALLLSIVYLLLGMALVSMCFSLMQDEVVAKFQWIGERIGLIKKEEEEEDDDDEDDDDDDGNKKKDADSQSLKNK